MSYEIFIKIQTMGIISLDVDDNYTIQKVMCMIQEKKNIHLDKQRLIFAGKQLEVSKTLLYYNIQKESIIDLCLITTFNNGVMEFSKKYDFKSIDSIINNGFIYTTKKIYRTKIFINRGIIFTHDDNKMYIDFTISKFTFFSDYIRFNSADNYESLNSNVIKIFNADISIISAKLSISSIFEKQPLIHILNYTASTIKPNVCFESFPYILDLHNDENTSNFYNENENTTINLEVDDNGVLTIPKEFIRYQFKKTKGYYDKLKCIVISSAAQLYVPSTQHKKIIIGKKSHKPILIKGNNIYFYSLNDLFIYPTNTTNKVCSLVFYRGVEIDGFVLENNPIFNVGQNLNNVSLLVYNNFIVNGKDTQIKIESGCSIQIKKHKSSKKSVKYINNGLFLLSYNAR